MLKVERVVLFGQLIIEICYDPKLEKTNPRKKRVLHFILKGNFVKSLIIEVEDNSLKTLDFI